MNKQTKREVVLPFPGFYESIYSDAIDSETEQYAECLAEREIENAREMVAEREAAQTTLPFADRRKIEVDESQLVTASEFAELFFDHCHYSKVYHKVAEFFVEAFDIWAHKELGLPRDSFTFATMVSPREYNFTTDRVFANISEEAIAAMWARSVEDNHRVLAEVIKERCTSYDGFSSFYSNDLDTWLESPLAEWDHNELAILLLAHIEVCDVGDRRDVEMALYEYTFSGNGEESEAFDAGMNWPKYEEALEKLREKKAMEASQV